MSNSITSTEAQLQLEAFERFYNWAMPLQETDGLQFKDHVVSLSLSVTKRFLIGIGPSGLPILMCQQPELEWMAYMPWTQAAIHLDKRCLILMATPVEPLKKMALVMPVDMLAKLTPMAGHPLLEITPFLGEAGTITKVPLVTLSA